VWVFNYSTEWLELQGLLNKESGLSQESNLSRENELYSQFEFGIE
jgi:hypothetical protein